MIIRNATQFKDLIVSKGLSNNYTPIISCLMNYNNLCNCGRDNEKNIEYNKCKSLYISYVKNIPKSIIMKLFTNINENNITFMDDNNYLKSISR